MLSRASVEKADNRANSSGRGDAMGQLRAVIDLPARAEASTLVRAAVRSVLAAWQLTELTADAELVASELFADAIRHAPCWAARRMTSLPGCSDT